MDMNEARRQLKALGATLEAIVDRDPDQEVEGMAVPVLDEVVSAVRKLLPDSVVVQRAREVISPEAVATGDPVSAKDALLVLRALEAAIPPKPRRANVW